MKLLHEPLVHFLVTGVLLFAGYTCLNYGEPDLPGNAARVVRITAKEIEWLTHTWTRQWQRPPTEDELKGLVAATQSGVSAAIASQPDSPSRSTVKPALPLSPKAEEIFAAMARVR